MEASCPSCKQIFTSVGGGREPLVITCGDSICNECIAQFSVSYSFICNFLVQVGAKCGLNIETKNFPVNRLYYEMQEIFNDYVKKKDYYDSPGYSKAAEDELSR